MVVISWMTTSTTVVIAPREWPILYHSLGNFMHCWKQQTKKDSITLYHGWVTMLSKSTILPCLSSMLCQGSSSGKASTSPSCDSSIYGSFDVCLVHEVHAAIMDTLMCSSNAATLHCFTAWSDYRTTRKWASVSIIQSWFWSQRRKKERPVRLLLQVILLSCSMPMNQEIVLMMRIVFSPQD